MVEERLPATWKEKFAGVSFLLRVKAVLFSTARRNV